MNKKILLVEDEKTLSKALKFNLEKEGFCVEVAFDGEEALSAMSREEPDLVILDLMLPKIDGYEVCRSIRRDSDVPIIMLTARDEDIDKILGLELGADDYMTKPFNARELLARIKAILRRTVPQTAAGKKIIKIGDLQIDIIKHKVTIKGREVALTSKEYTLLLFLASNRGKVYSREQLLEEIWGEDYSGDVRTVDVHVRHLREKIEEFPADPGLILTVWGTGYKFRED
ncbi:MAG: DNA-binding response regulator [Dethiobacter sp.]|jgi:DNA-binding response OmpR family regulator|nr:MAG: DNA-binding response regulator [Dethiobacter sp.]